MLYFLFIQSHAHAATSQTSTSNEQRGSLPRAEPEEVLEQPTDHEAGTDASPEQGDAETVAVADLNVEAEDLDVKNEGEALNTKMKINVILVENEVEEVNEVDQEGDDISKANEVKFDNKTNNTNSSEDSGVVVENTNRNTTCSSMAREIVAATLHQEVEEQGNDILADLTDGVDPMAEVDRFEEGGSHAIKSGPLDDNPHCSSNINKSIGLGSALDDSVGSLACAASGSSRSGISATGSNGGTISASSYALSA